MNHLHEYVIVGGSTKSATTSLFFYLKDHPEICSSSIKETRYWLEKSYPIRAHHQYSGVNEYNYFFEHCDVGIKMEATPDYLYSHKAPFFLKKELSTRVKLVFILRDPIDRLVSWFRYAKQDGLLNDSVSFSEYIAQMKILESSTITQQHLFALQHGRYNEYLKKWSSIFNLNQISFYFFEELKKDPRNFMASICRDIGIDPNFYEEYEFKVANNSLNLRSGKIHNLYKKFRYRVRTHTHRYRRFHRLLQLLKKFFEPIYLKLNARENDNTPQIDESTLHFLKDYYRAANDELNALIGDKDLSKIWPHYDCSNK